jgi:putative transcriptional regulator
MIKPLFTNSIRMYRAKFNMSQDELAQRVGVRRETIGNLEKSRYNPSLLLAMDIAEVFNLRVDELFQKINIGV